MLIKLTKDSFPPAPMWVNADHIVRVEPTRGRFVEGMCSVLTIATDRDKWVVRESPEEIAKIWHQNNT